eukprot:CAMPEP_0198611638 /NCGR_PEP_ID=MMETSP1462-20131121/157495_1 /TAXON_ID=1333877 /ORGANISM="Brandtodinium nutriculum, Strain RCC3387" /LENGTH=200 /DNA_ID=CAMNT_0044343443 /DNA_START=593 /DNA_END=1192 /DNA_ORIENTATION=-
MTHVLVAACDLEPAIGPHCPFDCCHRAVVLGLDIGRSKTPNLGRSDTWHGVHQQGGKPRTKVTPPPDAPLLLQSATSPYVVAIDLKSAIRPHSPFDCLQASLHVDEAIQCTNPHDFLVRSRWARKRKLEWKLRAEFSPIRNVQLLLEPTAHFLVATRDLEAAIGPHGLPELLQAPVAPAAAANAAQCRGEHRRRSRWAPL